MHVCGHLSLSCASRYAHLGHDLCVADGALLTAAAGSAVLDRVWCHVPLVDAVGVVIGSSILPHSTANASCLVRGIALLLARLCGSQLLCVVAAEQQAAAAA